MSIRKLVPIDQAEWGIGDVPSWVIAREPDWEFRPGGESAVAYLLLDEQRHVATQAESRRTVRQPRTLAAVQALGQAEVEFDPAAQRLVIHELAIWRRTTAGAWEKRSFAERDRFLLRQREQQMEQQMLNGSVSVMALLEDLRIGDAIDMAWTLESRETLPGLRFSAYFAWMWTVPVGRAYFAVHLDKEQPVRWKLHAQPGDLEPKLSISETRAEWSVERQAPATEEPNVPPGFWPGPVLDVSAWESWAEVAGWVDALWEEALSLGAEEVAAEASRLRAEVPAPQLAASAIRLVQEGIRYLAVDLGHGAGMLPNGAGVVWRRRFGDCKDKTVLLTALLRALGYEAWPLLTGPQWHGALAYVQPSTSAFNHVIVTFLADGERHFVDPTYLGQRGDLAHLVPPPYGLGLEVRRGVQALCHIPARPRAEITLTETFHLDRKHGNSRVEQVLQATSWLADDLRASVLREGEGAFFKQRTEVLQQHFPAAVALPEAARIVDDSSGGKVEIHAAYALPTWGPASDRAPGLFQYGPQGLFLAVEYTEGPAERKQPWRLPYPIVAKHRVVVCGPSVRRTKEERHEIHGPGFEYSCMVRSRRREVTIDYQWETNQSSIPGKEWPQYCRAREQAFAHAGANVFLTRRPFLDHSLPSWDTPWRLLLVITGMSIFPGLFLTIAVMSALSPPHRSRLHTTDATSTGKEQGRYQEDLAAARAAMQREEWRVAAPVFTKHAQPGRQDLEFQIARCETAIQLAEFSEAREAISAARLLDAGDVRISTFEALVELRQGRFAEAKRMLQQVRARSPSFLPAIRYLARIHARAGDSTSALAEWRALLANQPIDAEALIEHSVLLHYGGETGRADATFAAVAALPSVPAILHSARAEYYARTGRPGEAVEAAQAAAKLALDDPVVAADEVKMLVEAGNTLHALEAAERMRERFPEHPLTWGSAALAFALSGNHSAAEDAYQRRIQLAPEDPRAQADFGLFLHQTGRNVEALRVLQSATESFAGSSVAWLNYAAVLQAMNDPAAAKVRAIGERLALPVSRSEVWARQQ